MAERRSWSLRRRVLYPFVTACALFWFTSAMLVLGVAERVSSEDQDRSLQRAANLLLSFLHHERLENPDAVNELDDGKFALDGYRVQVWSAQGRLLLRSPDAPKAPISGQTAGFSDLVDAGSHWRTLTIIDDQADITLLIGERTDIRRQEKRELILSMLVPALVGLPLVGLLAWTMADRALRPVSAAADTIIHRTRGDLRPIPSGELPREVQPLVDGFNALFERLANTLEQEQRFAANVAHELRTPLASVRLNAQYVLQQHALPAPITDACRDIVESVIRADKVIEQLLAIARLGNSAVPDEPLDLARIARETVEQFSQNILQRKLHVEVPISTALGSGPAQLAYIVLRNLLENALRHCGEGGLVRISAQCESRSWHLQVDDSGNGGAPGSEPIAEGASGAHIGLALVRRIAVITGGEFSLGPSVELGGVCARFSLQRPW